LRLLLALIVELFGTTLKQTLTLVKRNTTIPCDEYPLQVLSIIKFEAIKKPVQALAFYLGL